MKVATGYVVEIFADKAHNDDEVARYQHALTDATLSPDGQKLLRGFIQTIEERGETWKWHRAWKTYSEAKGWKEESERYHRRDGDPRLFRIVKAKNIDTVKCTYEVTPW